MSLSDEHQVSDSDLATFVRDGMIKPGLAAGPRMALSVEHPQSSPGLHVRSRIINFGRGHWPLASDSASTCQVSESPQVARRSRLT
jgi:hypothetical protein